MQKTGKVTSLSLLIVFSLILSAFSFNAEAASVKAPTILDAGEKLDGSQRVLEVRGLAPANSDVLIYIDLQVAGLAQTKQESDLVSSFYYSQKDKLPKDTYQISAVARDKNSFIASEFSETKGVTEKKIVIEKKETPKVIPPTLLRSVVDSDSAYNQPKIIGQGLAGTRVEIYVDNKKDGQILLDENRGGTIQFEYITNEKLTPGQHEVFLHAFDKDNNRSEKSNIIFVNVVGEEEGRVDTGDTEKEDIQIETENNKAEDSIKKEDESVSETRINEGLEEILGHNLSTSTEEASGLIDEDQEGQSKLKLNLFVFLLFLIAIIVWIFWVNRELIKEKDDDDKDGPTKGGAGKTPVGDIDTAGKTAKKEDAEYGLDKKKKELDVLDF